MRGYYTGYSYCGIMPDGRKAYFATDQEYKEAYYDELKEAYNDELKELGLLYFSLHNSQIFQWLK